MTKVKICGITNLEDAMLSAKFGADALGFNFYEKSPRYILPEDTRNIIDELPEDILNVGVFVNEDLEKVIEIAKTANLDAIQLHGEETPEFAKELKTKTGLEIIKAFRVSEDFKPEDVLQYEVNAILLDAYSPKEHGGTGETFDWDIAKKVKEVFPKMYLAGGLNLQNVSNAVNETNPFAIDICSSLEVKKGYKNHYQTAWFIRKVKYIAKMEVSLYLNQIKCESNIFQLELHAVPDIFEFKKGNIIINEQKLDIRISYSFEGHRLLAIIKQNGKLIFGGEFDWIKNSIHFGGKSISNENASFLFEMTKNFTHKGDSIHTLSEHINCDFSYLKK